MVEIVELHDDDDDADDDQKPTATPEATHGPQQRRGKTQVDKNIASRDTTLSATESISASSSPSPQKKKTSTPSKNPNNAKDALIASQLNAAENTVRKNLAATDALHSQWRTHLLQLSCLLLILTLHQASQPMKTCMMNIKAYNQYVASVGSSSSSSDSDGDSKEKTGLPLLLRISGWKAMQMILADSNTSCWAIAMTAAIAWFLISYNQQLNNFAQVVVDHNNTAVNAGRKPSPEQSFSSNPRYMLANSFLPAILYFYYTHPSRQQQQQQGAGAETGNYSCLSAWEYDSSLITVDAFTDSQASNSKNDSKQPFPVVLIFHVIVSASCYFMEYQRALHVKNIYLVQQLQKDLQEASSSSKTTASSSSPSKNQQEKTPTSTPSKFSSTSSSSKKKKK